MEKVSYYKKFGILMSNVYNYQASCYTGIAAQPDRISVFVKKDEGEDLSVEHFLPVTNYASYIPAISLFTGVTRICYAANRIFSSSEPTSPEDLEERFNHFKNLFRGVIECIPIAGNIALFFYDMFEGDKIKAIISQELQGRARVVGIALDGRVLYAKSFEECADGFVIGNPFQNVDGHSDEERLKFYSSLVEKILYLGHEQMDPRPLNEYLLYMSGIIER